MTTIVTALMYSGRPNPSWELTSEQAEQLKAKLTQQESITMEMSSLSLGLLGYKGFMIESFDASLPSKAFCFDGILDLIDQQHPNFVDSGSELERFLLETASESLNPDEAQYISIEIAKNFEGGTASRNKSLLESLEIVPPFNPGKWNIPGVQLKNNCYNYANDKITNTFAQPGRGGGRIITDCTCPVVTKGANLDGQVSVAVLPAQAPAEGHYIALVSANRPDFRDYHWYRLDNNGQWSHKPGQTAARNTDNAGRLIRDPRNCDRGPYTDFCGFFHCVPGRVHIR